MARGPSKGSCAGCQIGEAEKAERSIAARRASMTKQERARSTAAKAPKGASAAKKGKRGAVPAWVTYSLVGEYRDFVRDLDLKEAEARIHALMADMTADDLDQALAGAHDSLSFEAEDGRYTVSIPKIVYVKRFGRESRVGFGAAA